MKIKTIIVGILILSFLVVLVFLLKSKSKDGFENEKGLSNIDYDSETGLYYVKNEETR